MANEIQIQVLYTVANPSTGGGYTNSLRPSLQLTQNTLAVDAEVVSVPTVATTYAFASLTTYGWAYLQNLDSTNYVQWGVSVTGTFTPLGRLKAGEIAIFRMEPGIAFQMKANTAACKISYFVLND